MRSLVLALALGGTVAAEVPGTLPKTEADRWVGRIQRLLRSGWTISTRGNDIIVQRDKPVRFARVPINAPAVVGPEQPLAGLREGTYRLTLRFAPKMSMAEYESLAGENAAADRDRERLHRAVNLPHKFDDFIANTPEEKERVQAYREAIKKLTWHRLPDLYAPDHSIFLFRSYDGWSYVCDREVVAECLDVQDSLLRYFGMYSHEAAASRKEVGQPEP